MSSIPAYKVVISETATSNETVNSVFAIPNNVGEGVVAADSMNVFNTLLVEIIEAANSSIAVSSLGQFGVSVIEDIAAADTITVVGTVSVSLTASASASDKVSRRLLWEPIDTGVDEDWTLINTNL